MTTSLTDTRPDARRVHVQLLRRAGIAQRVEMARGLSDRVGRISWHNLRDRHPLEDETETAIRFVRLVYGADLAERLGRYLANRAT
jgi:hypothetical protein